MQSVCCLSEARWSYTGTRSSDWTGTKSNEWYRTWNARAWVRGCRQRLLCCWSPLRFRFIFLPWVS